jgi:hypothetical protein
MLPRRNSLEKQSCQGQKYGDSISIESVVSMKLAACLGNARLFATGPVYAVRERRPQEVLIGFRPHLPTATCANPHLPSSS